LKYNYLKSFVIILDFFYLIIKMGKKSKNQKIKKIKEYKTRLDRSQEIAMIIKKIADLGLSVEYEGIKDFYKICQKFVNNDEQLSGKIKLTGLKRLLCYNLVRTKSIESTINLKYNENI